MSSTIEIDKVRTTNNIHVPHKSRCFKGNSIGLSNATKARGSNRQCTTRRNNIDEKRHNENNALQMGDTSKETP